MAAALAAWTGEPRPGAAAEKERPGEAAMAPRLVTASLLSSG